MISEFGMVPSSIPKALLQVVAPSKFKRSKDSERANSQIKQNVEDKRN